MRCFAPEGTWIHTDRNRAAMADEAAVRLCMEHEDILEATAVSCDSTRALHVKLPCMDGIIPHEEGALGIGEGRVRDIALLSRVGKPVCFTVTDIVTDERGRPHAVLSRRRAQELCKAEYIGTLCVGDVVEAKVTRLEAFGAFCDVGCGVAALLPIACMSVSRIAHPRDRVTVGDTLRCVVTSLEDGRICLSLRELLGTWEENAARFSQGETVLGKIRSVESYGVFVELAPNLAGLAERHEGARVGQTASVFIKSILPEKMKIKLVIIDTHDSDDTPPPLEYFCDAAHVDRFSYAPASCARTVATVFSS